MLQSLLHESINKFLHKTLVFCSPHLLIPSRLNFFFLFCPIKMTTYLNRHQVKLIAYGIFRTGLTATDAFKNLKDSDFKFKPKRRTIFQWFEEFRSGVFKFEDHQRSGRPPNVSNPKNIQKVRRCIKADNRRTIRTIARLTKLRFGTVRNIMLQKLKVKNFGSISVPHKLSEEEKRARKEWCEKMIEKFEKNSNCFIDRVCTEDESYLFFVTVYMGHQRRWLFPNEDYAQQPKFSRYTYKKRMFFLSFNRKGMIHIAFQPYERAANAENYVDQLIQIVQKSGLDASELILHHDNAPIHASKVVRSFLQNNRIELLSHPAYSPDLAPNDFWLIRKIKKNLQDEVYRTAEELLTRVIDITNSFPTAEFEKCFDVWVERMKKCVAKDGDYFEYKGRKTNKNKK